MISYESNSSALTSDGIVTLGNESQIVNLTVKVTGFDFESIVENIKRMKHEGRKHVIIVVSEIILGSKQLAKDIERETGFETRTTVLGYLQRGGTPSAMDRVSASVLGCNAVEMLINGEYDKMIYFANNQIRSAYQTHTYR